MNKLFAALLLSIAFIFSSFTLKKGKDHIEDPNDFALAIFNNINKNEFKKLDNYISRYDDFIDLIHSSSFSKEEKEKAILNREQYKLNIAEAHESIEKIQKEIALSNIDLDDLKLVDIEFKIKQKADVRTGKFELTLKHNNKRYTLKIKQCFIIDNQWKTLEGFSFREED